MGVSSYIFPDKADDFPAVGRPAFPLASLGRWAGAGRGLTERELLRRVRRCHTARHLQDRSDLELRESLNRIKTQPHSATPESRLVEVFAISDESIRRRLGAWRIFDPAFDRQNLEIYFQMAQSDTGTYAETLDLEPDADGQIIVDAIRYVQDVGRGRYWWDISLPAGFYQALNRKDVDGRLRFAATDEQILAGLHLFRGKIVEMDAGEGKTVAAAFPAIMHALLGRSVHILTANDYLAARDLDLLAPVYRALGLSADAVFSYLPDEERRRPYRQQIVYGTLREFGFDYLRDNLKMSPSEQVQGPLQVALVDEADQALIDEARTPLIIAGAPLVNRRAFDRAKKAVVDLIALQSALAGEYLNQLAEQSPDSKAYLTLLGQATLAQPDNDLLRRWVAADPRVWRKAQAALYPDGSDYPDETMTGDLYYLVDPEERFVTLTARGLEFLESRLGAFYDPTDARERDAGESAAEPNLSPNRAGRRPRRANGVNQVYQLLRAYLLLKKDVDYIVTEDAVILIDRYTGRPRPDSRYQEGLHPALEAKEAVTVHPDCETLAQVSVQGFANRYSRLAGMTGTAITAAEEFRRKYGIAVARIPAGRPLRRRDLPCRVYASGAEQLAAIADAVRFCQQVGRPVLVGVQTVEQSAQVSRRLTELGLAHRLLNAVTGHDEAAIVRQAGALGAVTVATNMAGRGTDIILAPDLDRRITDNYLALIRQRLDQGNTPVTVRCGTAEEAGRLTEALLEDGELSFTRRRGNGEELTITGTLGRKTAPPSPAPDGPLEFGLGLYVISAEFNESPRVALQLQGRSGRQGQFGATRFLLSWDDRFLAYRGRRPPGLAACRKTDAAGRVYFAGKAVERYLRRLQAEAEIEAAVQRSIIQDYAAVSDAHTDGYYRARRQAMTADNLSEYCIALAGDAAARLVETHFPGGDADNYPYRLAQLVNALRQWYGIEGGGLRGLPLDELPGVLEGRLAARLEEMQRQLGENRFSHLARLLLLQSGDEMWKDYRAGLQALSVSSRMGNYGHKSAVADYIIHAADAWRQFRGEAADLFLSRLLTFPLARLEEELPPPDSEIELDEKVAMLIS